MSSSDYDRALEEIRLRREAPVVGAVDNLGYIVCSACVDKGHAKTPLSDVRYGETYSNDPCHQCRERLNHLHRTSSS